MPEFDATTRTKIAALRALRAAGENTRPFEMVKVDWPSPTGTIWYSVLQTDAVASASPPVSPVEVRLVPESLSGNWFVPVLIDASIGDEEVDLAFWDGDGDISDKFIDHGEGVKVELYYWFPQVALLLPTWQGHLRNESDAEIDVLRASAAQGYRSADADVPGRAHWQECQAVFGGLFDTDEEAEGHDCPYDRNRGGSIGNLNGSVPFTSCPRRTQSDCTARLGDANFMLSHRTVQSVVANNQTRGPRLFSTSAGNETNLKEPVRVVMGGRRVYDMPLMAYRKDLNNNNPDHGWFDGQYECCEGPIQAIQYPKFKVAGRWQDMVPIHYGYRLGARGQGPVSPGLTTHSYSGTALMRYNFGWIDPRTVEPNEATATAVIIGLNDIRVYSDAETYTEQWSQNRVWHLARLLCDKRWGFGLDYARLDIDSWIATAEWAGTSVRFTDSFGNNFDHVRSRSDVELVGRKVQQQVEDMCIAGRISRPFLFDGKVHIEPLKALTTEELADCPVFTDTGTGRNVIWEGGKTTLRIGRKSDLDLPNRIECTYDDWENDHLETPLQPVEDIDAQLRAGRVVGDFSRKVNKKDYKLLGVVIHAHAIKAAWGLLDLGPLDEGGLANNCRITFKVWYLDSLDLHPYKVIRYDSDRLVRYGFQYFRILSMKREANLQVEITAQAYNVAYMDAFETDIADLPPGSWGGNGSGGGGSGGGGLIGGGIIGGGGIGTPVDFGGVRLVGGVIDIGLEHG